MNTPKNISNRNGGFMFCPRCGAKNDDSAVSCASCGTTFTPNKAEGIAYKTVGNAAENSGVPIAASKANYSNVASSGSASAVRPARRNKVIISVAVALVVVAVVAWLFALDVFSFDTKVDEKNFPNAVLRQAITANVDTDGNGSLSKEEKDAVTMVAYNGSAAIFGTSSNNVDVEQVRNSLSEQGASMGVSQEDIFESLKIFPNLNIVIASDAGLTSADMSAISKAEYIDLSGNNIAELDLSSCSNVRALFCDPSVQLVGLEQANLYYRDLLTHYETPGSSFAVDISYDAYGRPVKENGANHSISYVYDDAGRLLDREDTQTGSIYNAYTYNDDGTLASWTAPNYDGDRQTKFSFTYDAQGFPVAISASDGTSYSLTYDDGVPSSVKYTEGDSGDATTINTMQFSFEDGKLVKDAWNHNVQAGSTLIMSTDYLATYSYDQNGYLSRVADSFSGYGISWRSTTDTSLISSENGFPQKLTYGGTYNSEPFSSVEQTYECNSDGYIVSSTLTEQYDGTKRTITYDYVKFVSSYDNLASMRYVPIISFAVDIGPVELDPYKPMKLMSYENQSARDGSPFGVRSFGPQCFNAQLTGLAPQFLENANEKAIRERAAELYEQEMGSK